MKIVGRFFAQILVLILIVTTCFSLLVLTFLNSTKQLISIDNITNLVKQMDFKELMGSKIQGEIYEILEQTGLPSEYVDYVLENKQLKEYMGKYLTEGAEYLLYDKKPPVISEDEVTEVISSSFDQIIQELETNQIEVSNYLSKEEQQLIHQKIEYYVPEIVEKIPEIETFIENKIAETEEVQDVKQKLEEFRNMVHIVQKIYQYRPLLSIAVIIQLLFIILLKIKHFRFIKWLCIPFVATSFSLSFLLGKVPTFIQQHYPKELEFIKPFIEDLLKPVYQTWKQTSLVCLIIVILFICLQLILFGTRIYKNRRKKDMAIL